MISPQKILPIALLAAAASVTADARVPPMSSVPSDQSSATVQTPPALWITRPAGVSMHLTSRGLTPGPPVTIWFVAVRRPGRDERETGRSGVERLAERR